MGAVVVSKKQKKKIVSVSAAAEEDATRQIASMDLGNNPSRFLLHNP